MGGGCWKNNKKHPGCNPRFSGRELKEQIQYILLAVSFTIRLNTIVTYVGNIPFSHFSPSVFGKQVHLKDVPFRVHFPSFKQGFFEHGSKNGKHKISKLKIHLVCI